MLKDGTCSAWFKTPRRAGTGVLHLQNGKISGGDSVMTYCGFYASTKYWGPLQRDSCDD